MQNYLGPVMKFLWLFSILFLIFQGYSAYTKLPVQFATHFNASGVPDKWTVKNNFFIIWYTIIFIANVMILLVPFLVKKTSKALINIPNKDYWLSTDELRNECAAKVRTMLFGVFFWINLILIFIYESIIQSNIGRSFRFPFWVLFVLSGIMLVFSLLYSSMAFKKPE